MPESAGSFLDIAEATIPEAAPQRTAHFLPSADFERCKLQVIWSSVADTGWFGGKQTVKLQKILPFFWTALVAQSAVPTAAQAQLLKRPSPLSGKIAAAKGGEQAITSIRFRKVADIQVKGRTAKEATYTLSDA